MGNSPAFEQELRQNLHPGEIVQAQADSVRQPSFWLLLVGFLFGFVPGILLNAALSKRYKLVLTDRRLLVFQGTLQEAFALSALHGELVHVSTGLFFVHVRFQTPRSKHESKMRKGTSASTAIGGAITQAAGPSGLARGSAAAFDRTRRAVGSVAGVALLVFSVIAFLNANRIRNGVAFELEQAHFLETRAQTEKGYSATMDRENASWHRGVADRAPIRARSNDFEGAAALLVGCAAVAAGWIPRRRRAVSLATA
jgi:hypothetical protein